MKTGAWFLGGYRSPMAGTLGESLDLVDRDNLGWTLRSWKYELAYNGLKGAMILDTAALDAAAAEQIKAFQRLRSLTPDGVIGPLTGRALLDRRVRNVAADSGVPLFDLVGIVQHESSYDVGAIGSIDNRDRGIVQEHVTTGGVNLSQAIRPALALPRLAAQINRLRMLYDEDAAVASWNVGEGGAEWWFHEGKPATGSPTWWRDGDLAARATAYLEAVRKAA